MDDSTRRLIEEFRINNFIYFKRNVESPEQLKKLSGDLHKACAQNNLGPPLIAIDQEGGSVTRLAPPFTQFPDARVLAQAENPRNALCDYARVCSRELTGIGVNYNLAPVLDVCEAGKEYFMEKRSLGVTLKWSAGSVLMLSGKCRLTVLQPAPSIFRAWVQPLLIPIFSFHMLQSRA